MPNLRPSDRLLALAGPALLVAIALVQQVLVRTQHLSPWKGGGFGMFAGVDQGANRLVRVALATDAGEVAVDAQALDVMGAVGERARMMPSEGVLSRIARDVGRRRWVLATAPGDAPLAREARAGEPGEPLAVRGVRIEVLRTEFDRDRHELRLGRLVERVYEVGGSR